MDRTEAGIRAQTGEKPSGGYYTSSERITLQNFSLGRISTLPSSVFGNRARGSGGGVAAGGGVGGGGAGGGGSIVVRPQTSLVDTRQDQQIQQNQQSVGFLQQTLDFLRNSIQGLVTGISNFGKQLQVEGQVEQKNLLSEKESERKLNERKIREGRENLLERRIVAALVRPVAKVQQQVLGIFDRIMGALTTLFFGWLTNQGIETLKALSSGDTKKLEEIKGHVIKNLLYVIGSFVAIKLGFGLVMNTIRALSFRLAGLVAKLAMAPFRGLASLLGMGKNVLRPPGRVPITTSGGRVLSRSGNFLERFMGASRNLGRGAAGLLRGAGNVFSKVFTPLAIGVGTYRLANGDIAGGLLSYASAVPLIGLPAAGLDIAREFGAFEGTFLGKNKEQPAQPQNKLIDKNKKDGVQPNQNSGAKIQNASQPQTPAAPSSADFQFNVDTTNQINAFSDIGSSDTQTTTSSEVTPASIQAPPKPQTPVGTLPEPKPNIIMAGGGQDRTQVASSGQQETLTDVPFIPSGNPDNFYVLYSQLNYNVVM